VGEDQRFAAFAGVGIENIHIFDLDIRHDSDF
jgi:hypothetical protein